MEQKQNWLDRPIHPTLPGITNEIVIFALVMLAAIVTRFYDLGTRVMSHDESLHTYFSWLLSRSQGYQHSPMMHGPLQFHMIALMYFLFGANDFTSRIPAALFGIATVWMLWHWRRYLGRWGALIAAALIVISPFMLYYSRYVRNESFTGLSGVLMLYATLRHLEAGGRKYLYLYVVALILHFTTKETAFIYAAQALLYFAFYFIAQVTRRRWEGRTFEYRAFLIALAVAVLFIASAVGYGLYTRDQQTLSPTETARPADPHATLSPLTAPETAALSPTAILALIGALALLASAFFLIRGYTWEGIRSERSFDLLMLTGMLVLPMLSAFPVKWLERWIHVSIPAEAPEVQALLADPRSILVIAGFLVAMFLLSIAAGLTWNREAWWKFALAFWVPYTIFYTTVFTNSDGFFTGTIGSLGYWLVQQGVERGSQPWYFYVLVQIPMYEFLPALGFFLALIIGLRRKLTQPVTTAGSREPVALKELTTEESNFPNTFSLLAWWCITSVAAFSYAGERMAWLTLHLAWPMILITGWALDRIIEAIDWAELRERYPLLTFAAIATFVTSVMAAIYAYINHQPFQGKELAQLQATSAFLLPAIVAIASGAGSVYFLRGWNGVQIARAFTLVFFAFLSVLTGRAAFRAAYITYDQATEFLVYAHAATPVKEVIEQAREISLRTTGGMGVALAYDASAPDTGVSWPIVWYLRDFTNQRAFDQPTRALRDSVVVIVDEKNFDKIERALGPAYYRMDYIRMWWPMQHYFNLVNERDPSIPFDENYPCKGLLGFFRLFKSRDYTRVCHALSDPDIRAGILQIWLNRDYTLYSQATGTTTLTLTTWDPADRMRLYIRNDVASQIWNYGIGPSVSETTVDPTEGKTVVLSADLVLGLDSPNQVVLNAPRQLAFAPDGTFYVADSRNHRILHLNADGRVLQAWGSFADGTNTSAPPGMFNEPWGIAVGPDGSVYVADTWNHRIQKFSSTGQFVKMWGVFGQGETGYSLYGPRGLAVDSQGRVYVADTGNKRIAVFDADGHFLTAFGSLGFEPGQFDEPVAVTVDDEGMVYVTDTWNQRVQTFFPSEDGLEFSPAKQWDVYGWFGTSLENKPFIAVNERGHVFITDPEGYRVMEFDSGGQLLRAWGDPSALPTGFGLASGIAVDAEGRVWVTDAGYNRIMRFTPP